MPEIHGTVDPAFEPVREAFAANFDDRELGASLCIELDGRTVVDIWAGVTDRKTRAPWQKDTVGVLFSATKGISAACYLQAHARGLFDYDDKVSKYWPEFAKADKGDITIRTLLNHRSGLITLDEPLAIDDFKVAGRVEEHAARQRPFWEPDSKQGYHGVSWGFYAGPLFEKITGKTLGQWLSTELAGPLGADLYLGTPEAVDGRVATLYPVQTKDRLLKIVPTAIMKRGVEGRVFRAFLDKNSFSAKAFGNPVELGAKGINNYNRTDVRRLELPFGNGIGSARGLARLYGALALGGTSHDGIALIDSGVFAPVHERQSWADDAVLHKPLGWSQGFLKEQTSLFSPNVSSFGHAGAGGILGWADPDVKVGIGYVMNQMDWHLRSPRALRLCHALYGCL